MNRRRALRVPMTAVSVQVMAAGRWSRAALMDLSLWGARLVGDDLPVAGTRAQLQLSLAGRATRIETTTVWRGAGAGLEFDPLSAVQRRTVAEALLLAGYQDDEVARRAVLLLVNGSSRAPELAAAIRARGFDLAVTTTPLDAIQRLTQSGAPVRAAIVSGALPNASGEDLLRFLATEHPHVRRVLLLESAGPLSSVDARLADRVLLAPWTPDDLDAVFDLIRDRPILTTT